MQVGRLIVVSLGVVICLLLASCGDDGDGETVVPQPDAGPVRLIPPTDVDYQELETPELQGECTTTADCTELCTHSCALPPSGPFTCPIVPIPQPERLATADCICRDSICAWWEPDR